MNGDYRFLVTFGFIGSILSYLASQYALIFAYSALSLICLVIGRLDTEDDE